ncbi:MAG TPA: hypothetical protein VE110_07430, partial [Gemmatimonadaceae bacterium]|nr:hypothetical protein [Gemmatimonadaceae bacterium]
IDNHIEPLLCYCGFSIKHGHSDLPPDRMSALPQFPLKRLLVYMLQKAIPQDIVNVKESRDHGATEFPFDQLNGSHKQN